MNGKLRKIALGMSVLMCAGVLFTCALPAKAAVNACNHMSRLYLGWTDWHIDGFDDEGHYKEREEQACCEMCGKIFILRSETRKEKHYIYNVTDKQTGVSVDFCRDCNYHNP